MSIDQAWPGNVDEYRPGLAWKCDRQGLAWKNYVIDKAWPGNVDEYRPDLAWKCDRPGLAWKCDRPDLYSLVQIKYCHCTYMHQDLADHETILAVLCAYENIVNYSRHAWLNTQ